nr:hypothetical protein [Devosia crocina]
MCRARACHLQANFCSYCRFLSGMDIGDQVVGTVLNLYDAAFNLDMCSGAIGYHCESGSLDHCCQEWRLHREVLNVATLDVDGHDPRRLDYRGHEFRACIPYLHHSVRTKRETVLPTGKVDAAAAASLQARPIAYLEPDLCPLPTLSSLDRDFAP